MSEPNFEMPTSQFASAVEELVGSLGLTSARELWKKAGVETNQALWYKRINTNPKNAKPTYKKHIDELVEGLRSTSGISLTSNQIERLYASIGVAINNYAYIEPVIENVDSSNNPAEEADASRVSIAENNEQINAPQAESNRATQLSDNTASSDTPILVDVLENTPNSEIHSYSKIPQPETQWELEVKKLKRRLTITIVCVILLILSSTIFLVSKIPTYSHTVDVQIINPCVLTPTNPKIGEQVYIKCTFENKTGRTVLLDRLTIGVRQIIPNKKDWEGKEYDFEGVEELVLASNEVYELEDVQHFTNPGQYFAEPVVKINGSWGGVAVARTVKNRDSRIYFKVT
jgi:hypothetical protein